MDTVSLEELTLTQRRFVKDVKKHQKIDIILSRILYEAYPQRDFNTAPIYLNRDKRNSEKQIEKITGEYIQIKPRFNHSVLDNYVYIISTENKREYRFPLRFLQSYKKIK